MKALLICPDERFGVAALAEAGPLSNMPILGKSLVEYWLEHLAALGAKEVLVLTANRPEQVRNEIGNGARWGLHATVHSEKYEMTREEARAKHQAPDPAVWLPAPHDIFLLDHLPGRPEWPLTTSYADWFAAVRALMPSALTPDRIGVRELQPGVWAGWRAHIDSGAKLIGPCWIGDRTWIEAGAIIGPNAVLEKEVFVARGAEVSHSVIGPKTYVGEFTEVRNSIAWGGTLINWERGSCLRVADEFLLCSLEARRAHLGTGQSASAARLPLPLSAMVKLRQYVSQLLT